MLSDMTALKSLVSLGGTRSRKEIVRTAILFWNKKHTTT